MFRKSDHKSFWSHHKFKFEDMFHFNFCVILTTTFNLFKIFWLILKTAMIVPIWITMFVLQTMYILLTKNRKKHWYFPKKGNARDIYSEPILPRIGNSGIYKYMSYYKIIMNCQKHWCRKNFVEWSYMLKLSWNRKCFVI